MKPLLIDSSVLIAAFRKNEEHHQQAIDILQSAQIVLLLDYVLSETATVLKIRENTEVAQRCVAFLLQNKNVLFRQLTREELDKAISFFQKQKNKLSFTDTVLLTIKNMHKCPLATFDKELIKAIEA